MLYSKLDKCMLQIGKRKKLNLKGFSLVEILISLSIFSILIVSVVTITMSMINSQKKVQAKLFLSQTANTTLENMSRQIRYGYNYTGNTQAAYATSEAGQTIYINTNDTSATTGSSATSTTNLVNAANSPFILFESQNGNPNSWSDQNAFCFANGKLYKITKFDVEANGTTYKARCDGGSPMLPDDITLEKISFDIYAGDIQNPKNPMVRIKLRLKHEETGSIDVQTTIAQRLVTYF